MGTRYSAWWMNVLVACSTGIAVGCAHSPPAPVVEQNRSCEYALFRTQALMRAILDDLPKAYTWVGGGGIIEIRELATGKYIAMMSQEERIDTITYELTCDHACKVTILRRTAGSITP